MATLYSAGQLLILLLLLPLSQPDLPQQVAVNSSATRTSHAACVAAGLICIGVRGWCEDVSDVLELFLSSSSFFAKHFLYHKQFKQTIFSIVCFLKVSIVLEKFTLICCMQIEDHRLYFRDHAQSKCGSLDYLDHIPGGGDKKVMYIIKRHLFIMSEKFS